MPPYQLHIEEEPAAELTHQPLFTVSGLRISDGYTRIVIGDRGPYIEMHYQQIIHGSLRRAVENHRYFIEYRSTDACNLLVYFQTARVAYADYKPGMYYVSPFMVCTADGRLVATWHPADRG